jgi:hypothetical protein
MQAKMKINASRSNKFRMVNDVLGGLRFNKADHNLRAVLLLILSIMQTISYLAKSTGSLKRIYRL